MRVIPLVFSAGLLLGTAADVISLPRGDEVLRADANDNTHKAGTLRGARLDVRLVATRARWYPAADDGPYLTVDAFAEEGRAPGVPGPLIRASVGTTVNVALRNTLSDTLHYFWRSAPGPEAKPMLVVAPGETGAASVDVKEPGTYVYYGMTTRGGVPKPGGDGTQLVGSIVVDGAAPQPDRVMLMTVWAKPDTARQAGERVVFAINGKSWPHTERFSFTVGDTVRWRWISIGDHPMHLHGFYFRVDARGNGVTDTIYASEQRRLVVTENLQFFGTAQITWVPERAGNWVFHCHRGFHIQAERNNDIWDKAPVHPASHAAGGQAHDMGGLVIGVEVKPKPGQTAAPSPMVSRELRLLAQQRNRPGAAHAYGYVLTGDSEPAADSIQIPGPPLVLTRGEHVRINVVNRTDSATAVHWHGIELESFFDGVPGWSGTTGNLAPMIAPGDSFAAVFTPPRAGTFIYHSHMSELRQIAGGLYGPIIVLEPGQTWDKASDHLFVLGEGTLSEPYQVLLNGTPAPRPKRMKAGQPHRLRFINILAEDDVDVALLVGDTVGTWRAIAKDGATLPEAQAVSRRATSRLAPGETMDVEIVPGPGELYIRVKGYTNVLQKIEVR